MLKCPFCESEIADESLRSGRCPRCGSRLAWEDESAEAPYEDPRESPSAPISDSVRATLPGAGSGAAPTMDVSPMGTPTPPLPRDFVPAVPQAGSPPPSPPARGGGRANTRTLAAAFLSEPPPHLPTESHPTVSIPAEPAFGGAPPSALSGPQIGKTLSARELSAEDYKRMSQLWGPQFAPPRTIQMTAKGEPTAVGRSDDTVSGRPGSVLVIQPRTLRKVVDDKTGGADYELLEMIGEGGVGVVYAARQASIDRTVAVKMLKADSSAGLEQQEKFLSEAVVTGDLDHPNIVPIYDLGRNEAGSLFYSMKRVQGTPWLSVIRKNSVAENLEILMKVADAIAFAHARGVIHRDLKPENVMLGEFGEVLVMDWGIALATPGFRKAASITQSMSMGGTPAYMSPEMVTGPVERIGPCSDVYLLGALLYEMITGGPPHTGPDVMSCLYSAARNEIQPVEHTGELIDIAFRAMATDPDQRYDSVRSFQKAIRDYQSHAESIGLSNRAEEDLAKAEQSGDYQDYARGMFAFQEAHALWSGNTRALARVGEAKLAYARRALSKGDFDLGLSLLDTNDSAHQPVRRQLVAAQSERDARQTRLKNAKRLAAALIVMTLGVVTFSFVRVQRTSADLALANKDLEEAVKKVGKAAEDNKKLADTQETLLQENKKSLAGAIKARNEADAATRREIEARQLQEYESYLAQIGLAAEKIDDNAFEDARRLLDVYAQSPLRHWEWSRLRYLVRQSTEVAALDSPVSSVAFAPDGQRFAVAGQNQAVRFFDVQAPTEAVAEWEAGVSLNGIAYSPEGQSLALAGDDGRVSVRSVADGAVLWSAKEHTGSVVHVVFSPDGRWLLSSSTDGSARLWSADEGEALAHLQWHTWWVWGGAFVLQKGEGETKQPRPIERIVTVGQDGNAVVWSFTLDRGKPVVQREKSITIHDGPVLSIAASADGRYVATGGDDGRILVWDPDQVAEVNIEDRIAGRPDPQPQHVVLEGHDGPVRALEFSSGGLLRLVSGGDDNTLRLWDVAARQPIQLLRGHGGHVRSCVFSPEPDDSSRTFVLSGGDDRTARLWDVSAYREYRVLKAGRLRGHGGEVLSAAFDPQNRRVVTASEDRTAGIWHLDTDRFDVLTSEFYKEGHEFLASTAVFFDGGRKLATSAFDSTTRLWDVRTGAQLGWMDRTGQKAVVAVSADGSLLLTGSDDNSAKVWTTADVLRADDKAAPRHVLAGHGAQVSAAAVSPDGQLLFTGDSDGDGILWNVETGEMLRRLTGAGGLQAHTRTIVAAAFLPDGRLVTASADNTVEQWDSQTGTALPGRILPHPDAVMELAVSQDGRRALTACMVALSFEVRKPQLIFWDLDRAQRIRAIDLEEDAVLSVALSPDGRLAAAALPNDAVRVWDLQTGEELRNPESGPRTPYFALAQRGITIDGLAFPPGGAGLLTIGGNNARLWQLDSRTEVMSFSPHRAVSSAAFSYPDGAYVVTGSRDSTAKIWSVADQRVLLKLTGGHRLPINSAVFSPADERLVLTAGDDRTAKLWQWSLDGDAPAGAVIRTFGAHNDSRHTGRVVQGVFSPDGTRVLTVSSDRTARLWSTEDGDRPLHPPFVHKAEVLCGAFSADGRTIVTGCADWTVHLWDAATGGEIVLPNPLRGHTAPVAAVALSPDGRRILTGSDDGTAKIWDARTGKEILTLRGHSDGVTSVAFATDGPELLTGSRDGTAILWLGENVAPSVVLGSGGLTYKPADGTIILDENADVLDPDSTRLDGGRLSIRLAGAPVAGERLHLLDGDRAAGRIALSGNEIIFTAPQSTAAVTIGTLAAGDDAGRSLDVAFTTQASHAAVCALLQSLAYENASSEQPAGGVRGLRVEIADGDGGLNAQEFEVRYLNDQPAAAPGAVVAGRSASRRSTQTLSRKPL